jgi:ribonuclease HI
VTSPTVGAARGDGASTALAFWALRAAKGYCSWCKRTRARRGNSPSCEALLHGLRLAISLGIKRLPVYGDSLLVVQQVNKEWDCNKETMEAYVQEVRKLENKFSGLEVHHVLREHNVGADTLSKLGSTRAQVPPGVFV